ncbi:hypothetical protein ACFL2Q_15070 [Thermodesulfobacteriota bacterium]
MEDISRTLLGVPISTGSVCGLLNQAAESVKQTYEELLSRVPDLPFLNADETSRPQGPILNWLCISVSPLFVVLKIGPRTAQTLKGLPAPSLLPTEENQVKKAA